MRMCKIGIGNGTKRFIQTPGNFRVQRKQTKTIISNWFS